MTQASIQGKFALGCEFQGNPAWGFHNNVGYASDYRIEPVAGFLSFADGSILPNFPFYCGRLALAGALTVTKGSGTVASGLAWMGGNVSVSMEILWRVPTGSDVGDCPWTNHNTASADSLNCHYRLYTNKFNSNLGQFFVRDSTNTRRSIQEGSAPTMTQWNHYVCVVQAGASGIWKIYRNGAETASSTWTYGDILAPNSTWTMFNCSNVGTIANPPIGLHFVRYYAGILDVTEVGELYNSAAYRDAVYVNPNYRQQNIQTKIDIGAGSGTGSAIVIRT
jgi:hypothetical protein